MVVSNLCRGFDKPLVIRFSGGQQAGHTVNYENAGGPKHVFSSFGSGTLAGAHTYTCNSCTVDPVALLNEMEVLVDKAVKPVIWIDRMCPVTTRYDKEHQRGDASNLAHGTCGMGVGTTWQREEDHFRLRVGDLQHPLAVELKLRAIAEYYGQEYTAEALEELVSLPLMKGVLLTDGPPNIKDYGEVILESSQGLLLDQDIGFFPHVTRSVVGTSALANPYLLHLIQGDAKPIVYAVTRAYHTRHGNGPFVEGKDIDIQEDPRETNVTNTYQGEFRRGILDIRLLLYALSSDSFVRLYKDRVNLVVTCTDHIKKQWKLINTLGDVEEFGSASAFLKYIRDRTGVNRLFYSENPYPELATLD